MNQELDNKSNYVITIGRQFGSGGRELGKMLAEKFGIEYYDKKLLLEAANRAGMSPEVFERNDERVPNLMGSSVGFNMGYGQLPWYNGQAMMADSIYTSLNDVIEHLADTRPCVIVGRSADYVLRMTRNAVSSPARDPTISAISILSRAEQAPLASPGIVFTTTMF